MKKKQSIGDKIHAILFLGLLLVALSTTAVSQGLSIWTQLDTEVDALSLYDKPLELPAQYKAGVCVDETILASVKVYMVDSLNEPEDDAQGGIVGGRFYQKEVAIVLVKTDLNSVAHEVSHLVDWIMFEKGITDDETEAYLQGYFTECVYDLTWGLQPLKTSISSKNN